MIKEEIRKKNELIAFFMGWVFFKNSKRGINGYPFGGHDGFTNEGVWILNPTEEYIKEPCHSHIEYKDGVFNDDIETKDLFDDYTYIFKYHESWDWLIPVIDKIRIHDMYPEYLDYNSNIIDEGGIHINTKFIIETWKQVVDFVEWYNKKT